MQTMKLLNRAVVLVVAFCVLAIAQSSQQTVPKSTGQTGRYQISLYQGELPRMNTFLLDTQTGKVWVMVSAPDQTTFWEPMNKVDNDSEEMQFVRAHQKAAAQQ